MGRKSKQTAHTKSTRLTQELQDAQIEKHTIRRAKRQYQNQKQNKEKHS